jgi:hypothetical protein
MKEIMMGKIANVLTSIDPMIVEMRSQLLCQPSVVPQIYSRTKGRAHRRLEEFRGSRWTTSSPIRRAH